MSSPTPRRPPFDKRRALVGALTILALLILAALWQRAHPFSIQTSTDIDASPEEVWSVLTDFEEYPEWNPTLIGMTGQPAEGSELSFHSGDMDFTPTVLEVVPGRALRWEGHVVVIGLFDGEHRFTLEPLDGGGTRFTQREDFRGILVPFLSGMLVDETTPSFHEMNAALRERAEAL